MQIAKRTAASLVLVALVTYLCFELLHVNSTTVALAYLLVVLAIAARWGLAVSVVTSVAAMFCFNFFFLPPVGTLTIAEPQNWVALFAFLFTAIVASHLSNRAVQRAEEAIERRREMEKLYELSRGLLLTSSTQPMAAQICQQVARIFGFDAVAAYDRNSGKVYRSGAADLPLSDARLRDTACQGTEFQDLDAHITTLPVSLGGHGIGSLTVMGGAVSETALHAIANLSAIAIEKDRAQTSANLAEAARRNQQLKSTLLDAVAHEFKTPLTVIKAATTTLLAGQTAATAGNELLTVIDEEADRLSSLVTEAIQMASIEAGKLRIEKRPVEIGGLIRSTVEQFRPTVEDRNVEIAVQDNLPAVNADPDLLHLVLRQLLSNALKYSPPNSPLRITAEHRANTLVVAVIDHGAGISEVEQSHIFDRFYRAADARERVPGTGMGLAIAREIVDAHGGRIWVSSRPGQGSEFSFSLPLVTAAPALSAAQ